MAPPSGSELDSLLVRIDCGNVDDRPNPGHRAGKTDRKHGDAKLRDGFLGVSGIKIMRTECTEKDAENDEGHTILCFGVGFEGKRSCWRSRGDGWNGLRTEKHAGRTEPRNGKRGRLDHSAGQR